MIGELLSELGKRLGLDDLALEPNGTCNLIIEDRIDITIEEIAGEDAVYLYSTLGFAPATGRETLYGKLLSAHLFGAESGDAYFGLNPQTEELLLIKRLSLNGLNCDGFQEQLQEFTNWTLTWHDRLASHDTVDSAAGSATGMRV